MARRARPEPRSFVHLMPVPSWIPWRSVWLPRAVTAIALIVGLPLFLRSPPWCDITLYQLAARNLLHGGTHYRDLFDTNLPGFVWAMTALSWLFGPSALVVRIVDLCIVTGIVVLIDRLAKWGGATLAARWWAIAGIALFYPYTVEMAHAQRDTWMVLPGLAAVALRVRRGMSGSESLTTSPLRLSFYEGLLWGAAVWMKPHIALMALTVWLLTARRVVGQHPQPWRALRADLLGNVLGGLAVGLPGLVWMVASGTWEPFLTVFFEWNPMYMKLSRSEFSMRVEQELFWFPPWSMGLVLTVPVAIVSVLDMAPWWNRARDAERPGAGWLGRWLPRHLWDKAADTDARFVRGTLGGLYLVWAAQAFFIQRGFQYAHVPETLLMLGIWASHRWAWVMLVFLWLVVTSGLWIAADESPKAKEWLESHPKKTLEEYYPRHPITIMTRVKLWPQCWRLNMSDAERYSLWDKLRLHPVHEASIEWEELSEVADYLRAQGVRDGEVVAWFDSPHAIYLVLDIKPGFRYMHVYTAIIISTVIDPSGETGRKMAMDELKAALARTDPSRPKYVINDLEWMSLHAVDDEDRRKHFLAPAHNPPHDLLPFHSPFRYQFPFNQPTVFRARNGKGRYIVHRLVEVADSP